MATWHVGSTAALLFVRIPAGPSTLVLAAAADVGHCCWRVRMGWY